MSKNIWVINQFGSTPKNNVGSGERFFQFGKLWSSKGHKVHLFAGSYNHHFQTPSPRKFPVVEEKIQKNFSFHWVWVTKYSPNSGILRLLNWLTFVFFLLLIPKKRYGKPDILLLTSMSLWPIINVMFLRLRYPKAKFIFEIRDFWPVEMGNMSKYNPIILIMFVLEKIGLRTCDTFVSVLPNAKIRLNEIVSKKVKPFFWIPNGIDEKLIPDIKSSTDVNNDMKFRIGYSGSMGTANCLDVVIDSALKFEDGQTEFHFFGDGPFRDKLERRCESAPWVFFHGKIKKSDLIHELYKMDALIISWRDLNLYKYGVSANKYNDYMLVGKPIISASNIPNDPVTVNNCGIQVAPENEKAITNGVKEILALTMQERKILGQNGRNYLLKNQTYSILGQKYLNILDNV